MSSFSSSNDLPLRRGGTALHTAAEKGLDGMVALLLDRRAALEAKDDYGQGPRMGS